ncbi:MAG: tetratricopeptide (TPR) repeat protein [Saprospiraceae bacterium]
MSSILKFSSNYNGSLDELKSKIKEQFGSEITKSFYLNRLSSVYSRNGMIEKAILYAELNVELFPHDSNIWDRLGQTYYINGNLKKALVTFKEAVSLDANNTYAQEMLKKLTE